MFHDPWLRRWLPLIRQQAQDGRVLEIGCGAGADTATLAAAGLQVQAFDLSPAAVAAARLRVPSAHIDCRDVRGPWPPEASGLGLVLASLSLHYFAWDETVALAARVRGALRPGGVLLCRLNSTEDQHFGARGHAQIAPGYYLVDGQPKRFFDEDAIRRLFGAGWRLRDLEHRSTRKYGLSKALWELVAERVGEPGEDTDGVRAAPSC